MLLELFDEMEESVCGDAYKDVYGLKDILWTLEITYELRIAWFDEAFMRI